jgi:hypothetical protein
MRLLRNTSLDIGPSVVSNVPKARGTTYLTNPDIV